LIRRRGRIRSRDFRQRPRQRKSCTVTSWPPPPQAPQPRAQPPPARTPNSVLPRPAQRAHTAVGGGSANAYDYGAQNPGASFRHVRALLAVRLLPLGQQHRLRVLTASSPRDSAGLHLGCGGSDRRMVRAWALGGLAPWPGCSPGSADEPASDAGHAAALGTAAGSLAMDLSAQGRAPLCRCQGAAARPGGSS
jgi:hypothetical protein